MKMFRMLAIAATLMCATAANAQSTQRGFSVVLLLGETQSTGGGDGLPPAPALRKALSDVRDFLPYKSYRVLDTQWLRGGSTRMKGPDDQEYDVDLAADQIMPNPFHPKEGMLNVVFHLQEVGAAQNSSEEFGRSVAAADMQKRLAEMQRSLANGTIAEGARARTADEIAQLTKQIRMARARKLIDSKFEMAVGETVVVGTSKIGGGDKGLVVLLTSVAGGK
jgi:hypothetical protein